MQCSQIMMTLADDSASLPEATVTEPRSVSEAVEIKVDEETKWITIIQNASARS